MGPEYHLDCREAAFSQDLEMTIRADSERTRLVGMEATSQSHGSGGQVGKHLGNHRLRHRPSCESNTAETPRIYRRKMLSVDRIRGGRVGGSTPVRRASGGGTTVREWTTKDPLSITGEENRKAPENSSILRQC